MADWHDIGPAADLADGSLRPALVAGTRLVVGRSGDDWFALDAICPHAGGSLAEGELDENLLICPLHAFGFEIDTGLCTDDPTLCLRRYELRVADGVLQVRIEAARRAG